MPFVGLKGRVAKKDMITWTCGCTPSVRKRYNLYLSNIAEYDSMIFHKPGIEVGELFQGHMASRAFLHMIWPYILECALTNDYEQC